MNMTAMMTSNRFLPATLGVFVILLCHSGAWAQTSAASPRNITLPNGLRVIALPEKETSLVAINAFIRSAPENDDQRGIGAFVANTLLSGSAYMTTDEEQAMIGDLGGGVSTNWDADFTQIKILTLATSFHDAAWLISDVLKDASFPPPAVETTRKAMLGSIQSETDNLFAGVYDEMRTQLYNGTPMANLVAFDPAAVSRFGRQDLLTYYERNYTPRNIVVSVVGNIDPDQVEHDFSADLSDFPRKTSRRNLEVPTNEVTILDKPITVKKYRGDLTAAYIMIGYVAPGTGSSDYVAVQVANELLGGMKTSRLFIDLREKQGYGYQVASVYTASVGTGDLAAYIVTMPTKPDASGKSVSIVGTVKDALLDEIRQFGQTKPTDADLARAKSVLIGAHEIAHERIADRAYFLGYSEIAQKDLGGYSFDTHYADAVNAVTADDVQRVAKQYLGNGCVIAMLLPGDPNAGVISK